jgi:hypothetical protein
LHHASTLAEVDIKSQSEITDRVSRLEGKLNQALRSGRERPLTLVAG